MRFELVCATFFLLLTLLAKPAVSQAIGELPWEMQGAASLETFDQRSALKFGTGRAVLPNVEFANGEITFDMYLPGVRSFFYLQFRGRGSEEYEDIYFRAHKTELPDAIQYSPVFQGRSAWQLYHGPGKTAAVPLPANRWIAVRVQLDGNQALVTVAGQEVLRIDALQHEAKPGWLAFRGFIPRTSDAKFAGFVSNFAWSEKPQNLGLLESETPSKDESSGGVDVRRWQVSPAFDAGTTPVLSIPGDLRERDFERVDALVDGQVEFLRVRRVPKNSRRWAVVAKVVLSATEVQTCAASLGFSDEISVLLNGELLAYQDDSYSFDNPRRQGLMYPGQLRVMLPLRPGDNHLSLIVADRFGGWGLQTQLLDCPGIQIK